MYFLWYYVVFAMINNQQLSIAKRPISCITLRYMIKQSISGADPGIFVRGGPNFRKFWQAKKKGGREKTEGCGGSWLKKVNSCPHRVMYWIWGIAPRITHIPELQLGHCYISFCRLFKCLSQNNSEIWEWPPYKRSIDSGSGFPHFFYKLTSNSDMSTFGFVVVSSFSFNCSK